jgi:hypothetical protein
VGAPRPKRIQVATSDGAARTLAGCASASLFFREASNRGVRDKTSGAGTPRECFVMTSATSKRSPAGNADSALVGRDVISIDEPRRGNCHEISAIC